MKTFASIVITLVLVGAVCADSLVNDNSTNISHSYVRLAKDHEAPYAVFLYHSARGLFCSGAIIHPNWVLTAANCLDNSTFTVIAGVEDINELNDVDEVDEISNFDIQTRTIPNDSQYIIHELYENEFGNVNIAIIFIATPFDLQNSPRVKKINLPTEDLKEDGVGKLYGWGFGYGTQNHRHLFVTSSFILGYDECSDIMHPDDILTPFNICTPNQIGPCLEDSGAPLVVSTRKGDMLVGLATWGVNACRTMTNPAIYTNVLVFTDWIKEKTVEYLVNLYINNKL